MKWILVYIFINPWTQGDLTSYEPLAVNAMGPRIMFDDMYECFNARERLSDTVGIGQGYFGPGKQAVCIQVESTDI